MPIILDEADYEGWLAGEEMPLIPFPPEQMIARAVSTHVNDARDEGPE